MEKSLINQFKNSNSTLFHSTVLGTNSMMIQRSPRDHQIYKSRIAHLPADSHRQDLTRRLDFVVVFQTIQIQRLTQQIIFLKGRIRQIDGKSHNANSYQVQIRQLMQKCNKLENQKYSYRQQLSQTKDVSENIFNELSVLKNRYADVDFCIAEKYKLEKARNQELCLEIQKWKSRYASLDKIKSEEVDGYRRMMDAQKENMVNRDAKDLFNRFQLEKEELLGRLRERKEQVDQRELEIKKLQNIYEQMQVRVRQDNSKIQNYEQKVALLSQQTVRLSELVRAKHEQIRNLKMINEQDLSLRMSHITNLDETKQHLGEKVRYLEQDNEDLRNQVIILSNQMDQLKRKVIEVQRLEFQLKEARVDAENKFKSLERKDKKIIALEEDVRMSKKNEQQLKSLKSGNLRQENQIRDLQQRLDQKISQLRNLKQKLQQLFRWSEDLTIKTQQKIEEYEIIHKKTQREIKQAKLFSEKIMQQQANLSIQVKQFQLQLKQKDYSISSLQNELKQAEAKLRKKQLENKQTIQQLEDRIFNERRNFESNLKEAQSKSKETDNIIKQAELRVREAEMKFKDYQMSSKNNESKILNLQSQCKDLQSYSRTLEERNSKLQYHIKDLQLSINQLHEQNETMRHLWREHEQFYKQIQQKYFQTMQEMKSLRSRLENIQNILISLKNNVAIRLKTAKDADNRINIIQRRYQQLYQWFCNVASASEKNSTPERYNDSPQKRTFTSTWANGDSSRFITSFADQSTFQEGTSRGRSKERISQNVNLGNREKQIPIQFLLKHVLLCAQVQSLRKKVGDKNAKVQSMRNSIINKGYPQMNGFSTTRESSLSKKTNIYY